MVADGLPCPNCGLCECDILCGGNCPDGFTCDNNDQCSDYNDAQSGCEGVKDAADDSDSDLKLADPED